MNTCEQCFIFKKAKLSKEPAACIWYINNVVCGNKSKKDCPYRKIKGEI